MSLATVRALLALSVSLPMPFSGVSEKAVQAALRLSESHTVLPRPTVKLRLMLVFAPTSAAPAACLGLAAPAAAGSSADPADHSCLALSPQNVNTSICEWPRVC